MCRLQISNKYCRNERGEPQVIRDVLMKRRYDLELEGLTGKK